MIFLKKVKMGKSDFTALQFNSSTDNGSIDFPLYNELNDSNIQLDSESTEEIYYKSVRYLINFKWKAI